MEEIKTVTKPETDRIKPANIYGLRELPEWVPYTKSNDVENYQGPARWSGKEHDGMATPPKIGDRVYCAMNSFGYGTVVAYLVEYGFLGIEVKVEKPPAWYVQQRRELDAEDRRKGRAPRKYEPMFFGVEVRQDEKERVEG